MWPDLPADGDRQGAALLSCSEELREPGRGLPHRSPCKQNVEHVRGRCQDGVPGGAGGSISTPSVHQASSVYKFVELFVIYISNQRRHASPIISRKGLCEKEPNCQTCKPVLS